MPLRHMVTLNLVNIGLGIRLLSDGNKPLLEPKSTCCTKVFYGIHFRLISRKVFTIATSEISIKLYNYFHISCGPVWDEIHAGIKINPWQMINFGLIMDVQLIDYQVHPLKFRHGKKCHVTICCECDYASMLGLKFIPVINLSPVRLFL